MATFTVKVGKKEYVTLDETGRDSATRPFIPMKQQVPLLFILVCDFAVTIGIYVGALYNADFDSIEDRDIRGFDFETSMFDLAIIFVLRVVLVVPFAAMARRSQICCEAEDSLAFWGAVISIVLIVCKAFLLKDWGTARIALVAASLIVCILEALCVRHMSLILQKQIDTVDAIKNAKVKKIEDARSFFYDDPEAHVKVGYLQLWFLFKPYFWPAEGPNKLRAAAAYVFMVGTQVCTVMAPFYIGYACNSLDSPVDLQRAALYIGLYVGLNYAAQQLTETQNCIYQEVRSSAYRSIARKIFAHLMLLSIDWHLKKRMGVALRVIDRGQTSADNVIKYLVLRLLPALGGVVAVCVLYITKFKVPGISVVLFLGLFLYTLLTVKMTVWRKNIRKMTNVHDNKLHDVATDCLTNIETVKFFCSEEFEEKNYAREIKQYQKYTNMTQYSLSALNLAQQMTKWLTIFFMLLIAANEIKHTDKMVVGDFVTVLTFGSSMFSPLSYLGTIYGMVVQALVDLLNVLQLLNETPDVQDKKGAQDLELGKEAAEIVFENVHFSYPSQKPTSGIQGISFTVPRGTTTALVGSTGAGKTTIGRLLFRFYNVSSGRILINGQDIAQMTKRSVRHQIGMVPQEKSLFNKSVKYNVKYGRRDASDAELDHACESAQILDFILGLSNQWDSVVGERGLKLSGGEKQRVAIARALLKDPPIVVLDEATSALDTVTERAVQKALAVLAQGRTQLIIAHRLSTVRQADQIIVLEKGRIVERGTHHELLKLGKVYMSMVADEVKLRQDALTGSETKQQGPARPQESVTARPQESVNRTKC